MGKTLYYIKKGIPLTYILSLRMRSLAGYMRGMFYSFFFERMGKRLKIGNHSVLRQKRNITFGQHVQIGSYCEIDALSKEGICLGDNASIGDYSIMRCTGSFENLGKGCFIGDNSHFAEYSFFGAAGGVYVGNDVVAGQFVRFHSENHNYDNGDQLIREQGVSHKGIKIGSDCWIGAGAVFLDGAIVGDGCVIAANAVVRGIFPDNSVIGGVPARVIAKRTMKN